MSSIWYFFRYNLPNGVKNLVFFFGAVWRFRGYDYGFTLHLLRKSLEKLRVSILKGNEVEKSKMKKVKKIERAIQILENIEQCNYIEMAEKELGQEVKFLKYKKVGTIDTESDQDTTNDSIFNLAEKLEDREWQELWRILKGQNHNELDKYLKFIPKASARKFAEDWFDGSGINSWWS